MITKIDWLSFTLTLGQGEPIPQHRLAAAIKDALEAFSPTVYDALVGGYDFEIRKGRPPYSTGFARSDSGCYIFCNGALPHFLIEVTGRGCDALADREDALNVLQAVASRLTRIDVASDMLCDTNPLDFVATRKEGRFSAHSEVVSQSGTTCYVGSRTSNRYARVYRYNAPHERAHLLRAEHVAKAEDAKLTAQAILSDGIDSVAAAMGQAFGWQHTSWLTPSLNRSELAVWRPERHAGKTLFWLNNAVAPALLKLCREGGFDATEWLQYNVLSKLSDADSE